MKAILYIFLLFAIYPLPAQTFSKEDLKTVKEEGDYLNGKKVDLWKEYYKDNVLKSIGEYEPASPEKIIIIDPDKNLVLMKADTMSLKIDLSKDVSFKKGQWKYFYPDGKLESVENYIAIFYCAPGLTQDIETGLPILTYNMPSGELHGKQMGFYHNGKTRYEADYINGRFSYQKFFDENGNLETEQKAEIK